MDDFVPTRSSKLNPTVSQDFVSVKYVSHKKKKSSDTNGEKPSKITTQNHDNEKDMDKEKFQRTELKRARYDVIKFSMSGYRGIEAKEAKMALAISLGAKPFKKKSINYKTILEQKKQEKLEAKEPMSGLTQSMIKYNHKKKNPKSTGILKVYGKVNKKSIPRNNKYN